MADRQTGKRTRRALNPAPATGNVQAAVEGVALEPAQVKTVNGEVVDSADAVQFLGEWYRIAAETGLMPLLKFAAAADRGLQSGEMAAMAAMYAMLRDTIHPDDWTPFEYAAIDGRADDEQLLGVTREATQKILARPTKRPSGSSAGPQPTSPKSRGSSSQTGTQSLPDGLVSVDALLGRSTG